MDLSRNQATAALWSKVRGTVGVRFARFVPVAIASLATSQVALIVFNHALHFTAGIAGFTAAVVGAGVSYVLSRWAWERKGRPHLLKETLPFWAVSVCVWVILAGANKLGVYFVHEMGLHKGWKKVVVENGTYFAANCVTFVGRFLIFHYVLFADRGKSADSAAEAGDAADAADAGESFELAPAEDLTR